MSESNNLHDITIEIRKYATKAMNFLFERAKFYDEDSDNHMFLQYIIGEYGRLINDTYWDDFKDMFCTFNYRLNRIIKKKDIYNHATYEVLKYTGNKDNDIDSHEIFVINRDISRLINKMDFTYEKSDDKVLFEKISWVESITPKYMYDVYSVKAIGLRIENNRKNKQ